MENNVQQAPDQLQTQINSLLQTTQTPATSGPKLIVEKPKGSYFSRLFSGRMNRQNYIVGSTVWVLIPFGCFLVVIFNIALSPSTLAMPYINPTNPGDIVVPQVSLASLLFTPANEFWIAVGTFFLILSLPYLLSIQIKRLHDLNWNGWLWIINILPLLFLKQMFSISELIHPDGLFEIASFVSLVSFFFSFYVACWPGTHDPNKYGDPPIHRSSFLGDVMEIR